MIRRQIAPVLRARLRDYPAVALVGPRQAGKTTLARSLGGSYFDLEQDADRLRLNLEWERLLAGPGRIVLDEAQSWPEVFPKLRGAIDRARGRKGRFLLLGSVSPALMRQVSESLAGRLALVELTPLLVREVPRLSLSKLWCYGGYPEGGALHPRRFPRWQRDYLSLLVHRDLPLWGLPAKPQMTERLVQMLAAVHGQIWNASQIGQSLGLSYHTVNDYLDYLVGAFLLRRLRPYQANLSKRLVKSPKIYWRDSGLLHALLHLSDQNRLLHQPWVGSSWEGFVIEQILGVLGHKDLVFEAWFFRTSDQHESDLVLEFGQGRWAIEIKLTASPSPNDMDRLNATADLIRASHRFLISQTRTPVIRGNQGSCDLKGFVQHVLREAR